jgi:hypothetical protein
MSEGLVALLRELVQRRLDEEEDVDRVLNGAIYLGRRRAELSNRELLPADVGFTLSLFCRWILCPEVDEGTEGTLRAIRADAFATDGFSDALDRLVPDATLMLTHEAVSLLQLRGQADSLFAR